MKFQWRSLLNILLLVLVMLLASGFQSIFWYQILGNLAAPMIWLNVLVYVMLYRKPFPAILIMYGLAFLLLAFTGAPLKMLWISLLILFVVVNGIKNRVFWPGSGYYAIMCALAAFTFQVIYLITSQVLETNSTSIALFDRLIQFILTPTFAFPLFWVLSKIDKMTLNEPLYDQGGIGL